MITTTTLTTAHHRNLAVDAVIALLAETWSRVLRV
jgi:hypothetical protein